jgi:serine/threonine protein kinase
MRTDDGIYKIIDFTTNKSYSNEEVDITAIKSPGYTAPELERRKAMIGEYSDIYSIGMTLFKVLSLKNPPSIVDRYSDDEFFQQNINRLDISDKFKNIIRGMVSINIEDRFQNLSEIEDILNGGVALPIGYRVGDYKIEKLLGQDEFNIIYLARDINTQKPFVIKEFFIRGYSQREPYRKIVLTKGFSTDILKRVYKEQKSHIIKGDNILLVYKAIEKNYTIYSIIEYIDGLNLEEYIENNSLSIDDIIDLLQQLIEGLKIIHKENSLHKALYPSNIMRTKYGRYKIDYLLNPIVALEKYLDINTIPSSIVPYCSNEVLNQEESGAFSDIYSLGMIVCRVLMKREDIYDRELDEERFQNSIENLDINPQIKDLILDMIELDSIDRFQDLEELSMAIRDINSIWKKIFNWLSE